MKTRAFPPFVAPVALMGVLVLITLACASAGSSGAAPPTGAGQPTGGVTGDGQPSPTLAAPIPAVPEQRILIAEWPNAIRSGDSDVVRLRLEMDEQGNITPTAEVGGDQVSGKQVQIPNLYATHNIVVEARLDMAGVDVAPPGDSSEPLRPGGSVLFLWSVRPQSVGTFRGTLWVHLRFIPHDGSLETRSVLSAQQIEIRSVNLLGLGGTPARVLGTIGTLAGSVLGLDNVVPWVWKALRRKKGK